LAISRFDSFSRMAQELAEARSELENRKLIDRTKGRNHKETLAGACAAAK
jgi:AmiR/NasT family two-component response regulator